VTVIGKDDTINDGDITYSLSTSTTSTDPNYNNLASQNISITNINFVSSTGVIFRQTTNGGLGLGTNNADQIVGNAFAVVNDTIAGFAGNDSIYGLSGNDSVDGGFGEDLVFGGIGNDTLLGNIGNDTLINGTLGGG